MRKSNYDKQPATLVEGNIWQGWDAIRQEINNRSTVAAGKTRCVIVVECYQGVHHEELWSELKALNVDHAFNTSAIFKTVDEVKQMTYPYITDDRLFGFRANFSMADFLDAQKLQNLRNELVLFTVMVQLL